MNEAEEFSPQRAVDRIEIQHRLVRNPEEGCDAAQVVVPADLVLVAVGLAGTRRQQGKPVG